MQPNQTAPNEDTGTKLYFRRLLRVRDRLMRDGNLTAAARLVGWYIFWRVNKKSRDAWPSHETIAEDLKISLKTAKRATLALRKTNYITCELDGRFNRYKPVLPQHEDAAGEVPTGEHQSVTAATSTGTIRPMSGPFCPSQGTIIPADRDQNGPLSPYVRTPSMESPPGLPPYRGAHAWTPEAVIADQFWWQVRARLEQIVGQYSFKNSYADLHAIEVSETTVVLSTESRFVAHEVCNRLAGTLVHCIRRELPTVQHIQIQVGNDRMDVRGG